MKVLLDENIPHELRLHLEGHDVYTIAFMDWASLHNGKLLQREFEEGFDAMVTLDSGVPYQNDPSHLPGIVVVKARISRMDDLTPLAPAVINGLASVRPGSAVHVG